jgi:hypothetical protein
MTSLTGRSLWYKRKNDEVPMQGSNKERWRILCEQAAGEQDPKKLLELTKEINDLLMGKQHRLDGTPPDKPKDSD